MKKIMEIEEPSTHFRNSVLEKGIDIHCVQSMLGHANINTTAAYAHTIEDMMKREAAQVGNFFDNSCTGQFYKRIVRK